MRPLLHPAIKNITVEGVLHALADPVRVALYAEIIGQECSANCSVLQEVLAEPIPKSTLSQHIRVLREAGLIRSEHRGVEVLNSSRSDEVDARFPGLLGSILSAYHGQMLGRKVRVKRRSL
jgi:DNA-binding transcriptional ArsR family regulator